MGILGRTGWGAQRLEGEVVYAEKREVEEEGEEEEGDLAGTKNQRPGRVVRR